MRLKTTEAECRDILSGCTSGTDTLISAQLHDAIEAHRLRRELGNLCAGYEQATCHAGTAKDIVGAQWVKSIRRILDGPK